MGGRTSPKGRFGRGVTWVLLFAQLLATVVVRADPPDALPELSPAEKALLALYLQRKPGNLFRGPSLGAIAQVAELGPNEIPLEHQAMYAAMIAGLIREDPDRLIQHFPALAQYIERGRIIRQKHYEQMRDEGNEYLKRQGYEPELVDTVEAKLLDQMKLMRKYRELKIKEYEAKLLAREAARKRTRIDPLVAEQIVKSQAELTTLETALMGQSVKLYSFLTEYYKDETKLTPKFELPDAAVRLWKAQARELLDAQMKLMGELALRLHADRGGTLYFIPHHGEKSPEILQGHDAKKLLEVRFQMQRALVEKLRELALGDDIKTAEQALKALEGLKALQEQARAYDEAQLRRMARASSKTRESKMPEWLDALAWWHDAVLGHPKPPAFDDAKGKKAVEKDLVEAHAILGLPDPSQDKDKDKPAKRGTTWGKVAKEALRWGGGTLLAIAMGLGAREALRHSGVELPGIPLPSLFQTEGNGGGRPATPSRYSGTQSSLGFDETMHGAGNFGMEARGQGQELYRLSLGSAKSLEGVPTAFEFAFLEERTKPKTEHTFSAGDRKPEFSLKSKLPIRPTNGWFSVAHTSGFDTGVVLTAGGRTLVAGEDYKVWRTESGTLLVELLKDKSPANLEAETSHYRAAKSNPPSQDKLTLTTAELDRLIAQTEKMEAEGMTTVAKALRERAEAAKKGRPLLVTELARIVSEANFYSEIEGPRVIGKKGTNDWSKFREIPREGGSLVMQCSVANEFMLTLASLVFERPDFKFFNVDVLQRDPKSPSLTVAERHVYPVLRAGTHDPVALDGTPSKIHILYARQPKDRGRSWVHNPITHTLAGLGLAAAGAAGLGWYLKRRRSLKEKLDEAHAPQQVRKKNDLDKDKGDENDGPRKAKEKPLDPRTADVQDLEAEKRNAERRRLVQELRRLQKKMIDFGEAFGVDPGRADRSFPFPTGAEAARLLAEFVSGETQYASRAEFIQALGKALGLDAAEREQAKDSVRGTITLGKQKMMDRMKAWKEKNPGHKNMANLEANTMKALDALLSFMEKQAWTPVETLPSVAAAQKANVCNDMQQKLTGGS